jgi:hypothetical protein
MVAPGRETPGHEVSLKPILASLRFVSRRSTDLTLDKPVGQQLQRIRQLTPFSAGLLERIWQDAITGSAQRFDELQARLDALGDLDREVVSFRRQEQAFLRAYLFGASDTSTCALCASEMPVELLIAAHIKPRAECNDSERRDFTNNVVPMCLLGCDALFERGLVVVDKGKVRVRLRGLAGDRLKSFSSLNGQLSKAWKPGRIPYFEWHARHSRNSAR